MVFGFGFGFGFVTVDFVCVVSYVDSELFASIDSVRLYPSFLWCTWIRQHVLLVLGDCEKTHIESPKRGLVIITVSYFTFLTFGGVVIVSTSQLHSTSRHVNAMVDGSFWKMCKLVIMVCAVS